MTEKLTPVGRIVQGDLFALRERKDSKGTVKLKKNGEPLITCYFALAIAKNDPAWPELWAAIHGEARAAHPECFDGQGNCTRQNYSFKVIDGDGTDTKGKSNAEKDGFAGHFVLRLESFELPPVFPPGKHTAFDQLKQGTVKRGDYVRVLLRITKNKSTDTPGLYLYPLGVEYARPGDAIHGGPDFTQVFGASPIQGVTSAPPAVTAGPGAASPPLTASPGPAPAAAPPPYYGVTQPVPGVAPSPSPEVAPAAQVTPAAPSVRTMTPAANGVPYGDYIARGWTDAQLIERGLMTP